MILLPVVAYSSFCDEYKNLNKWEASWYYKEQCAMKYIFGINANIKFIKDDIS